MEIVRLKKDYVSDLFDCGDSNCNRWFMDFALANQNRNISRTFILVDRPNHSSIVGYYSISANIVLRENIPKEEIDRFPQDVPVALIGQLAVNKSWQNKGMGKVLLVDALKRCFAISNEIGVVATIVEARTELIEFYTKFHFKVLSAHTINRQLNRLWLNMKRIEPLVKADPTI